ncbi:MAG TPA: Rieske 2Fe-2S domain-containing protein [Xanthobacteraceae bacterium]|nr:Rieske 2Fe-2S domain-containing protein [Xanthobacteraceae bacterium]
MLHPGAVVSKGRMESKVKGHLLDGEWGVFDLIHRIHVHHTYPNFIPLISSKDISVLVTPWGKLPVFFQVVTARTGPSTYSQSFSVFGVLYCHQISKMTQQGDDIHVSMDWFLVSHWLFKWMHYLFDRRLARLQREQNAEDAPLRDRRLDLRKRGLHFVTDEPDFINANDLSDHVILPKNCLPARVSVEGVNEGEYRHLSAGPIELLVRRQGSDVVVWPGLCPHEGAKMDADNLCEDRMTCPWHGRAFRPVVFPKGGNAMLRYLGLGIERDGEELVVKEA